MAEINDRSKKSPEKVKENEDIKLNNKKLTLALSKLLEESLSISDDTILEKLFTHLVTKIKFDGSMRTTLTVYVQWLCLVMKRWTTLQSSVQVFAIRLAGVVASTPVGFFMLEEQQVIAMLKEHVFIQETQCDSSLMLAMVNFITEAVKHQVGCNWVIQTEIWRSAVKLCHTDTSLYTTKASAKFITHLVLLFEEIDKGACHLVIDAILGPLCIVKTKEPLPSRMEILKSLQLYVSPDGVPIVYGALLPKPNSSERTTAERVICRKTPISTKVPHRILLASIRCLNEVLYVLLKTQMSVQRVNDIFQDYSLEMWAWDQVQVENDDVELLRSLSSMLTLLNFLGTEHSINGEVAYCDVELLNIATLRLTETLIYKRQYALVFDICVHCHKLRGFVVKKVIYTSAEMEKPSFDLGNQLISVQGLPLFVFVKVTAVHSGDVMDKYAEKLFAVSHNETLRACYQFRELLRRTPNINMCTLSQQAVVSMMRCMDYVDREQAVIIFQTMMHVLRQFVPEEFFDSSSVVSYQSQTLVQKCPILLMHLLECITIIISRFHITWHESLETLCLLTFSQALISNPHLTPRLCAQTLKLIQQVIEKFIPPNLALLVDTLENSSIVNLGSLLLSKLHDSNWEVRDSALEVLQVIGRLSDIMFPAFQTLLLEPNLLDSMVDLVMNDLESYVRGTSMICLCELVKVQNLWDKKLSSMSLPLKAMDLIKNESEGLVRKAACQLITSVYKHQKVSPSIEKDFHHRMFRAAIHDLYWEVKVSALDFWEAVFDHELANEGMIDGAFPGFTFSKQTRQIVSLTRQEIHKRLARVLDKLERVGCLQVLWSCLHDECDLQVVRAAVRVIHKLMNLLSLHSNNSNAENKSPQTLVYDTFGVDSHFTSGKEINDYFSDDSIEDEVEDTPREATKTAEVSTDNVIDLIVEHDDIDLLSLVYKLNSNREPTSSTKTQGKFITAKQFLKKMGEIDIDEMVNSRSTWLENSSDNLESLLDDVLAVNNNLPELINNVGLDCY